MPVSVNVPNGQTVLVVVGDYTLHVSNVNGKVNCKTVKDEAFEADLPAPLQYQRHAQDVEIGKNLTMNRIPIVARQTSTCRVIVWEFDKETGSRSVLDIAEGTHKDIIWFFNKNRKDWIERGCHEYARIEPVHSERD